MRWQHPLIILAPLALLIASACGDGSGNGGDGVSPSAEESPSGAEETPGTVAPSPGDGGEAPVTTAKLLDSSTAGTGALGGKIAFSRVWELYTMSPDGSDPTFIDNIGAGFFPGFTLSPDGTTILYPDEKRHLTQANADGSGMSIVADLGWQPAWSPDGDRIAFIASEGLLVVNIDGSGRRVLIPEDPTLSYPSWTPSGDRISFLSVRGLEVINLDGSDRTVLSEMILTVPFGFPDWSPDGGRIAVVSEDDCGTRCSDIYFIEAAGSGLTNITNHPATYYNPSWSPDGSKIAFESDRDSGQPNEPEIYVVNADGSGLKRLTDTDFGAFSPAWSPDGGHIGFATAVDGSWRIYAMSADGSDVTHLADNPGPAARYRGDSPRWLAWSGVP